MSKFHELPVASVERETRDAIAVTFNVPETLRDLFRFEPGQHLTLRTDIDGEDIRRSYSICAPAGGAVAHRRQAHAGWRVLDVGQRRAAPGRRWST